MRGVSRRGACAYVASTSPQKSVTSCDPFAGGRLRREGLSIHGSVDLVHGSFDFSLLLDCNGFASWRSTQDFKSQPWTGHTRHQEAARTQE